MASSTGGSVVWILDADGKRLQAGLVDAKNAVAGAAKDIDKQSSGIGSSIANAFSRIGSIIGTTVVAGTTAAGAGLVSLGAFGLKSGSDLQKTAIAMNGLTHSTELGNKAFSDLFKFAQSSPFAFPEVANAGKILLSYGLTVQQTTTDIKVLGNIVAATGADFANLADIYGRVNAQGHLMGGDITQLVQNGVAILPVLEKQLGKTADQVRDMASAGEISASIFNKAMASLVDPAILAQFDNTLPRAIDRLKGSIRTLAFAFVGIDISSGFKQAGDGLTQAAVTTINNVATALRAPALLASFAVLGTQMAGVVTGLIPLITPLIGTLSALAAPLIALVGGLFQGIVALLATALPGLQTFLKAVTVAFNTLAPVLADVGSVLGDAITASLKALTPLIAPLAAAFQTLAPSIAIVAQYIAIFASQLIGALAPAIAPLAEALFSIIQAFTSAFAPILPVIVGLVGTLAVAFADLVSALAPVIVTFINGLAPVLPKIVNGIVALVNPLIHALGPILPQIASLIGALATAFLQIVVALLPLLPPLTTLAVQIIQQILLPIMPQIVRLITLLANAFVQILVALLPLLPPIIQLASMLIDALAPVLPQLADLFIQLVGAILPILPPLLQLATILLPLQIALLKALIEVASIFSSVILTVMVAALQVAIGVFGLVIKAGAAWISALNGVLAIVGGIFSSLLNAVSASLGGVVTYFKELPGKVIASLGNLGGTLYNIGRDLIQGLLNGADSLLSKLGKFFLDKLPAFIRDPFKKALGIASPSKVFAGYGANLVEGLVKGVGSSQGLVDHAIGNLSRSMNINSSLNVGTQNGELGVRGAGNTVHQENTFHVATPMDLQLISRELAWSAQNAA